MCDRGHGSSSHRGLAGVRPRCQLAYSMQGGADHDDSVVLRSNWAKGVRVNGIAPGMIETSMSGILEDDDRLEVPGAPPSSTSASPLRSRSRAALASVAALHTGQTFIAMALCYLDG